MNIKTLAAVVLLCTASRSASAQAPTDPTRFIIESLLRSLATAQAPAQSTPASQPAPAPQPAPVRQPEVASQCVTSFGACPMLVAVPQGSSCYCATYQGPVPGIAR